MPSFQVGEALLLRDANLKRFYTPVEFCALEEDRALVLIRGHFVVVPLVSLRRPDGYAWQCNLDAVAQGRFSGSVANKAIALPGAIAICYRFCSPATKRCRAGVLPMPRRC